MLKGGSVSTRESIELRETTSFSREELTILLNNIAHIQQKYESDPEHAKAELADVRACLMLKGFFGYNYSVSPRKAVA